MTKRPEFSLAYLTVLGTAPEAQVEIAAEAGYDHVGLRLVPVVDGEPEFPFFSDPTLVRRLVRRLNATGLTVLDVEVIRLGPEDHPRDYGGFLDIAREIGARHLTVHLPDPDRERATDRFAELCEMAGTLGMDADLEFLPWTATPDLVAAAAIVTGAGQSNGGVLVDALHFFRSNSTVLQVQDLPTDVFGLMQLCDAPRDAPTSEAELIHAARTGRSVPGGGELALRSLVEALPQVPYSLEVPNVAMCQELGVQEFVRHVLESSRRFVTEAAS